MLSAVNCVTARTRLKDIEVKTKLKKKKKNASNCRVCYLARVECCCSRAQVAK